MGLGRYLLRKALWYLGAFIIALILNFFLPRLIPGNPVDAIASKMTQSGSSADAVRATYAKYYKEFGLDKPLWEQFFIYLGKLAHGDLGQSITMSGYSVNALVGQALPWSLVIQLPAILVGWLVGNFLGAIAAFKGGWFDRGAFTASLFLSSMPYYCLAILLMYLLGIWLQVLPPSGAYSFSVTPGWNAEFFGDAISYWWLPFWSLVLVFVGGQAVGMRSMAIYELGSDYVNYNRGLGMKDSQIVRAIFRNAMLPQITGLALSIGGMVGGALITELVFSYPGMGSLLFKGIAATDYAIIQGVTLIITIAVLLANFAVEVAYGIIDPRIRSTQGGDKS